MCWQQTSCRLKPQAQRRKGGSKKDIFVAEWSFHSNKEYIVHIYTCFGCLLLLFLSFFVCSQIPTAFFSKTWRTFFCFEGNISNKNRLLQEQTLTWSSCACWPGWPFLSQAMWMGRWFDKVIHQQAVGTLVQHVDVSQNSGTPKSSILIGFSIVNHPVWGTPIFGNTHVVNTEMEYKPTWPLNEKHKVQILATHQQPHEK